MVISLLNQRSSSALYTTDQTLKPQYLLDKFLMEDGGI
jgi:hypothetical protein